MDKIEIYKMSLLDLETIAKTLLSDFDDFWSVNTLKSELKNPNSQYIVAKKNNNIVGFGGIWKSVDDIHITNIVVNKNFRKQNIGSKILTNLLQICKQEKDITSITLEVNCTNIPAQKIYEKFGFKKVGLRKKYYNNTNDAIIMTMEVTNEKE